MPKKPYLTVLSHNLEENGAGDPVRLEKANRLAREVGADLVFRQELWGADLKAQTTRYRMAREMGPAGRPMASWTGERCCTAVFANPDVFDCLAEYPNPWSGYAQPPTGVALQLRDAGSDSTPLIAGAGHLAYPSPKLREIEAEWFTTFNDKWVPLPSGEKRHGLMIAGVDANDYPRRHPGAVPAEPELPKVDRIKDRPHRAHRSRVGPNGVRATDQAVHDVFTAAGLVDVAQHIAATQQRTDANNPLAPTMRACATHGPDARVDWLLSSRHLTDAPGVWVDVEVLDTQDISDHNALLARLSLPALTALLRGKPFDIG
ncbi:hypothetical protein PUR57_05425 [Streptomyces sp. JV176]|uniref:hypothetical protein n=1 Tax=Streptomyces sp. JV176 TaxID=858630 RepID=UPI002E75B229|nr:hypothetical protein [Streptomyces sp. JV176]MEE1798123.1 hypothetical protein [Streptomyces sp. JV176]